MLLYMLFFFLQTTKRSVVSKIIFIRSSVPDMKYTDIRARNFRKPTRMPSNPKGRESDIAIASGIEQKEKKVRPRANPV